MDTQTQSEIDKILEEAKPLIMDISEKLVTVIAQKYIGVSSPVVTELTRALLHGIITSLELELLHKTSTQTTV
jgi:hypothetical protein